MKKLVHIAAAGVAVVAIGVAGVGSTSVSAYSIYGTGPFSHNSVYDAYWNSYTKTNWNNINLNNYNWQKATTGNAWVHGNTFGGGAYTGAASNWNNTSNNLSLWNY